MDCRNGVISCKRDDWRLLDKSFKSKPIKEGGKRHNSTTLKYYNFKISQSNSLTIHHCSYFTQPIYYPNSQQYEHGQDY